MTNIIPFRRPRRRSANNNGTFSRVVQAQPGAVQMLIPRSDGETAELWLSPDDAEMLSLELAGAAKDARRK